MVLESPILIETKCGLTRVSIGTSGFEKVCSHRNIFGSQIVQIGAGGFGTPSFNGGNLCSQNVSIGTCKTRSSKLAWVQGRGAVGRAGAGRERARGTEQNVR